MGDTLQERLRYGIRITGKGDMYDDVEVEALMRDAADALDAKDAENEILRTAITGADGAVQRWGRMIDERDAEIARLRERLERAMRWTGDDGLIAKFISEQEPLGVDIGDTSDLYES